MVGQIQMCARLVVFDHVEELYEREIIVDRRVEIQRVESTAREDLFDGIELFHVELFVKELQRIETVLERFALVVDGVQLIKE